MAAARMNGRPFRKRSGIETPPVGWRIDPCDEELASVRRDCEPLDT